MTHDSSKREDDSLFNSISEMGKDLNKREIYDLRSGYSMAMGDLYGVLASLITPDNQELLNKLQRRMENLERMRFPKENQIN